MIERAGFGTVPRKHHIALRRRGGRAALRGVPHAGGLRRARTPSSTTSARRTRSGCREAKHGWAAAGGAHRGARWRKRHYQTQELKRPGGAPMDARDAAALQRRRDAVDGVRPTAPDPVYFSNADGDELFYIHAGRRDAAHACSATCASAPDDYVYVPRGLLHRFIPDPGAAVLALDGAATAGASAQAVAQRGRPAADGRALLPPRLPAARVQGPHGRGHPRAGGEARRRVPRLHATEHSPLDVVGWDGTVYPWAFPILNFQPRAGLVHLPPTWHGTFAARGALICSFVPRVVDFHPEAIPCPYPHASVDCDEFLFYCAGQLHLAPRRRARAASATTRRASPHGPHPGAYEGSIGHQDAPTSSR